MNPSVPAGPLELFDELPRMTGAIPQLWLQQGEILTEYAKRFKDKPDVAVELPTGTGKTIVGLLIAEWRRRKYRESVLYACPTQQLVHQVAEVAKREGMPCVTLIGSHRSWAEVDKSKYFGADALGLTTYSSIFNASPKVRDLGTIVFDDAHAAEQYVAESWSVTIERSVHSVAYDACLKAVRPALSGMFAERMEQDTPDINARRETQLVVPLRRPSMSHALDRALKELQDGSNPWWSWQTIHQGLGSCLVYVSWHEILIRPFIPPTLENSPFADADQRVYLSAKPGHAGELERSFGRRTIERLLLPDRRSPRSGRRFFVFAELAEGDGKDISAEATSAAGKALVLATSTDLAQTTANELNVNNWPVLGKVDIEQNLGSFTDQQHAILALGGRYDGIDLPNDACRLVCLAGLPEWAHLQERFLATNLRAQAALGERTRTRVVQGAGRATRNPLDYAVVLIRGSDLTGYLASPIVRESLDVDLQAELGFGLENSRDVPSADLVNNVSIFLEQGYEWREGAESHIATARRNMFRQDPEQSSLLAESAKHEVDAWASAFRGDFNTAQDAAQQAALVLSGNKDVQSYRAFWLYQAAVWAFALAETDPNAKQTAASLLNEAHKAAQGTTWLREVEVGTQLVSQEDANDTPAVREIAKRLSDKTKRSKIKATITRMQDGIPETDAKKFETALREVGVLLGAESFKPQGQGRTDCAWCWSERVWIAIEAKSEQSPSREISLNTIRQANTQMDQLSSDRGVETPALAATVVASPRTAIADEAVTGAHLEVYLVHPKVFYEISDNVSQCWDELRLNHHGHTGQSLEALVRKTMNKHRVLPTQIFEQLTSSPIRS